MVIDFDTIKKEIDTTPWIDEEIDIQKVKEILDKHGHKSIIHGTWAPIIEEMELADNPFELNTIKFSKAWFEIMKYFNKKYGEKWIIYTIKLYRKISNILTNPNGEFYK